MEDQKEYSKGDWKETVDEIGRLANKVSEIESYLQKKYDLGYDFIYCRICNQQMLSECGGGICHTCREKEKEYQQKNAIPFSERIEKCQRIK